MSFLFRRLILLLLTMLAVFTITFFLMRIVPGGPFHSDREPPAAVLAAIEARYDLDAPLPVQYGRALSRLLQGDLGPSFRLVDYRVVDVIAEGLPRSLLLGGLALWIATALGWIVGLTAAARPGSWVETLLMAGSSLGLILPNFVIAAFGVLLFAFWMPILPAAGWGSTRHLLLPTLCLAIPYAAAIARLIRAGVLEAAEQDFFRTALAKGLSRREALRKHALRPGLVATVSFLGPAAAGILTGSLVIEQIFAIPGLGTHFVQAALDRDYPLAMGVVLLYTAMVGGFNILVDLAIAWLDPRVRGTEG